MLRDTMDLLAGKGPRGVRPVAARVAKELKSGWGLRESLEKQQATFPPLFLALAAVGEESGNLPEVMGALEKYYTTQQQLRRELRDQIFGPLAQLVAAVGVVTLLIYVLGLVAQSQGSLTEPIDPLGLGLVGTRGAITFLAVTVGTALGLVLFFRLLQWLLRGTAVVERLLLCLPVIGSCLRAMAMARFCVALRLMLETNLSVVRMFRLAFQATDNAAFIAATPRVEASLRRGNGMGAAMESAAMFDGRFLAAMHVAEESGRLPEELLHQAEQYDEEARRRLILINKIASWLVWGLVAVFIAATIFRIYTVVYLKNLEKVLPK
jgi:type II secretory pathway component PulF